MAEVADRFFLPQNKLAVIGSWDQVFSGKNKASVDAVGVGGGVGGVGELSPEAVPQFERFYPACDKPIVWMRGKGYGFDLPVLLMEVGGSGDDGEVDEVDHEDATLSLLTP